jgi:hypothetical protein
VTRSIRPGEPLSALSHNVASAHSRYGRNRVCGARGVGIIGFTRWMMWRAYRWNHYDPQHPSRRGHRAARLCDIQMDAWRGEYPHEVDPEQWLDADGFDRAAREANMVRLKTAPETELSALYFDPEEFGSGFPQNSLMRRSPAVRRTSGLRSSTDARDASTKRLAS